MSDLVGNPEDRFSHNEAHIGVHVGFSIMFACEDELELHWYEVFNFNQLKLYSEWIYSANGISRSFFSSHKCFFKTYKNAFKDRIFMPGVWFPA